MRMLPRTFYVLFLCFWDEVPLPCYLIADQMHWTSDGRLTIRGMYAYLTTWRRRREGMRVRSWAINYGTYYKSNGS
ncbi:hypothetical protein GGS24DRAFT_360041 [Hypoxylon argillaceum]|nr:hypothetical protein GGS24DRAFT_360041 [Hypoxylon argillaceum]